jgi:4-aminobutyrate aminotransferase-like enzyme
MRRVQLFTRAADIGGYLKAGLEKNAKRHPMVAEVRGRGLPYGIEQAADRNKRRPLEASFGVVRNVVAGMRKRDVIIAQGLAGTSDQIQLSPPFIITEGQVDVLLDALDDTLADVARLLSSGCNRSPA